MEYCWEGAASYFELVKAQCEVQDLGELLGQRLLPLQVLSGVVVRLAGQSSQEAVQRRLCRRKNMISVRQKQVPVLFIQSARGSDGRGLALGHSG